MCIIKKLLVFFTLIILSVSYSKVACSESGLAFYDGMSKSISMVDKKKRIIKLADTEFVYDKNTVIVNYKGEVVSADSLRKDDFVKIRLDINQRYIGRPVLKRIQIETGD